MTRLTFGLPVMVALGLVISAVGMSGCSRLLDRRTRTAQARVTDLKAMGDARSALKAAEVEAVRADDLQRLDLLQRLEWTSFDWRCLTRNLRRIWVWWWLTTRPSLS